MFQFLQFSRKINFQLFLAVLAFDPSDWYDYIDRLYVR